MPTVGAYLILAMVVVMTVEAILMEVENRTPVEAFRMLEASPTVASRVLLLSMKAPLMVEAYQKVETSQVAEASGMQMVEATQIVKGLPTQKEAASQMVEATKIVEGLPTQKSAAFQMVEAAQPKEQSQLMVAAAQKAVEGGPLHFELLASLAV